MTWISWKNVCKPKDRGGLGLLTSRNLNIVSLSRLCWKLENTKTLATQIIHDKYIKGKDQPLTFKKGSHVWKSIGVGWEFYKHSIAWNVGNGESINLWDDKWVNGDSLRSLIHGPLEKHQTGKNLNTLKMNDLDFVTSFQFPSLIKDRVDAVHFTDASDSTYSLWTQLGKFSSKKAVTFMYGTNSIESWDWVWRIPGHPKQKLFIWQIWWERMPTNENIGRIIEGKPTHCHFCPDHIEDMAHILRKCHRARDLWGKSGIQTNLNETFKVWLKSNCENTRPLPSSLIPHNVLFVFLMWSIWTRRNCCIFKKVNVPSIVLLKNINWAATEWFYCQNQTKVGQAPSQPLPT